VVERVALSDTERASQSDRRAEVARRGSPVRLGSVPLNSEEDLRFLQDRLALFAKLTFWVSTMFLIVTTSSDLVSTAKRYPEPSRTFHVIGTLLALGAWRYAAQSRVLSSRALDVLDIGATLGICWSFTGFGHFALQPYGVYTGLLAVTHVSLMRAMIVPSAPRASFVLGVASFVGFIVSRSILPLTPEIVAVAGNRVRFVLEAVLWSAAGVSGLTVASTVLYGLREKALEVRRLGQYSLGDKIGEGGMGAVYRAHHAMLRRPTAIKLLSGDGSEAQLRRFEREVQLTARLTHPNTISIYDYGRTPDGVFYYAMELLEGMTLEELVERHGPQPPGRAIHLLIQVCGALHEAHRAGLIHRDIKPANIFLSRRGEIPDYVKVLDFGLVRQLSKTPDLTQSAIESVVGTPLYLSPEAVVSPDRVDARTDIYALGCVAYFLVTGTPPFLGKTLVELCAHHLHTVPTPPSAHRPIGEDFERLILDCLAKLPDGRPQSAEALSAALTRCSDAAEWTTADADRWWREIATTTPPKRDTEHHLPESHDQLKRTVFPADLDERLEGKRTA